MRPRSARHAAAAAAGAAALVCALASPIGENPAGLWESVSDVDGKASAHIRIVEVNGEFQGTVEEILKPEKRGALCDRCTDERANQPVLGMRILNGMRRDGEGWGGGRILDPDSGSVYKCTMKLVDGGRHLEVRGFIGFSLLGRTQTWNRLQ